MCSSDLLTATPPETLSADQALLVAELFGDVVFDASIPAVVREGDLAPFAELAWLTVPTAVESDWLESEASRFSYDLILDLVAHRSVFAYRRALARGGVYRCVGGSVRSLLRVVTVGAVAGRVTGRSLGVLVVPQGPAHFEPVAARCAAGEVDVRIDRTVGLDDVPAALAHVGAGRACGKVVVEIA